MPVKKTHFDRSGFRGAKRLIEPAAMGIQNNCEPENMPADTRCPPVSSWSVAKQQSQRLMSIPALHVSKTLYRHNTHTWGRVEQYKYCVHGKKYKKEGSKSISPTPQLSSSLDCKLRPRPRTAPSLLREIAHTHIAAWTKPACLHTLRLCLLA